MTTRRQRCATGLTSIMRKPSRWVRITRNGAPPAILAHPSIARSTGSRAWIRCAMRHSPRSTPSSALRIPAMAKRNAFYAQSGGVTAVINTSAAAVIETARKHRDRIGKEYGGGTGISGALTEDLIDTSKDSARAIAALLHTPAGAFGSCRYKLKSL